MTLLDIARNARSGVLWQLPAAAAGDRDAQAFVAGTLTADQIGRGISGAHSGLVAQLVECVAAYDKKALLDLALSWPVADWSEYLFGRAWLAALRHVHRQLPPHDLAALVQTDPLIRNEYQYVLECESPARSHPWVYYTSLANRYRHSPSALRHLLVGGLSDDNITPDQLLDAPVYCLQVLEANSTVLRTSVLAFAAECADDLFSILDAYLSRRPLPPPVIGWTLRDVLRDRLYPAGLFPVLQLLRDSRFVDTRHYSELASKSFPLIPSWINWYPLVYILISDWSLP